MALWQQPCPTGSGGTALPSSVTSQHLSERQVFYCSKAPVIISVSSCHCILSVEVLRLLESLGKQLNEFQPIPKIIRTMAGQDRSN